jgi:Neuraminidase (sialidase)
MGKKRKLRLSILLLIILTASSSPTFLAQAEVQSWIKHRLTNNLGSSLGSSIAVSRGNIHVVWHDNTPGNAEIFYRRSTDNGTTWGNTKRLTKNTGYSSDPAIAVTGSNIHVVWSDYTPGNREVYYKRSTDNGRTWSKQKRLTKNAGSSSLPSIAVSGHNIHVTWYDDTPGNDEIYYKQSIDNGANWSKQKRLTKNSGSSVASVIAVSGSNLHLAWSDDTPGNLEIYYRRSTDNGVTWRKTKRLTKNDGLSLDPSIAVSGGNVHVVWKDYSPGNAEILYKGSRDKGVTWGKQKRLTKSAEESAFPAVAALGNKVSVVWNDSTPGNIELYLKRSGDNGTTWGKQKRLTKNDGSSRIPDVALSDGNVHVVWQDTSSGNVEIFYKRGP